MDWRGCLKRGLLRDEDFDADDVARSCERAREWLRECRMDIDAGAYNSAISAGYMAMFHSARALLFRDGLREKSHFCVARYLGR